MNDPLRLVGTTLAHRYDVESLVRIEAHGIIYRATQRIANRAVAVRVLTALSAVPPEIRKAVYHRLADEEARLTELVPVAPALQPSLDVGTVAMPNAVLDASGAAANGDWVPYAVLAWPHGITLRQLTIDVAQLPHAPRALHEVIALLEPVAVALAIAHEHGVVHGAVSPDHVLFGDEDERGVRRALLLGGAVAKLGCDRPDLPRDPRDDVQAFAALVLDLFAAANGAGAWAGPTPRSRGLHVTDEIEQVFARALGTNDALRFATVGELWSALRTAMQLPALRSLTATIPPESSYPTERSLPPTAHSFPPASIARASRARLPRIAPMTAGISAVAAVAVVATFSMVAGVRGGASSTAAATPARSVAPPPPPPACPEGMVAVPGGSFFMGSDDDLDVEKPAHRVRLHPFCMDRYEVTTADYKACSDRGDCKRAARQNAWDGITDKERDAFDPLCNAREPEARGEHPINCLTWEMAAGYCRMRGARLPTEAEWEYAARGSDGRRYPWGDAPPGPGLLNACGDECVAWEKKARLASLPAQRMYEGDDGWVHTAPVGSFPKGASRFGVEDVVGNVWEWVADWEGPYGAVEQVDPPGPPTGDKRVMRGGAWNGGYESWVRPTFRFGADPAMRSYGVGFRCARDQTPAPP